MDSREKEAWNWSDFWCYVSFVALVCNVFQYGYLENVERKHAQVVAAYEKENFIEEETREFLEEYIRNHNRTLNSVWIKRLAATYYHAGREFRIDPMLLVALSKPESSFDKYAISHKGARGLMQVMPFWAKEIPFLSHPDDLWVPELNIRAGAYILAKYIRECGGLEMGLRCYHGGYKAITNPIVDTLLHVDNVLTYYRKMEYM